MNRKIAQLFQPRLQLYFVCLIVFALLSAFVFAVLVLVSFVESFPFVSFADFFSAKKHTSFFVFSVIFFIVWRKKVLFKRQNQRPFSKKGQTEKEQSILNDYKNISAPFFQSDECCCFSFRILLFLFPLIFV